MSKRGNTPMLEHIIILSSIAVGCRQESVDRDARRSRQAVTRLHGLSLLVTDCSCARTGPVASWQEKQACAQYAQPSARLLELIHKSNSTWSD